MVGYDDWFKAGANPFPCDDLRATNFRGGISFDLSQFDTVATAELLLDAQRSVERSNGEIASAVPPRSFATTLGVGTQPFSSFMPDTNQASLPSSASLVVTVSGQVSDWVTKVAPNFGFVLGGPRGSFGSNPPKDNDAKVTWYGNVRLRLLYNPALNPRAPQ